MKVCAGVPEGLVEGWRQSTQTHRPGEELGFHYHDVDECLEVVDGSITFFTLGEEAFHVTSGRALRIPHGEIHRADVGSGGVEYRMFLPVAVPEFAKKLTEAELGALRRNLEFPDYEDGRREDGREFPEH